jgi:hypothetical protein
MRKVLSAAALAWSLGPGIGCLLLAGVLAMSDVNATVSVYTALVGLGLLVIAWVRLNW